MNQKQYCEALGEQVYNREVLHCPACSSTMYSKTQQAMSSMGDERSVLFCPHCDRTVLLT